MIKTIAEFYGEIIEVNGLDIEIDWEEQEFHIFKDSEFLNTFSRLDDAVKYCMEFYGDKNE